MADRSLGAGLSHGLAARGVEVIFGIPGVHNIEMYRGIETAGLRHVLARHEQGAAFMADGYARATGKPGVAYLISGPGVTNALTPLAQAYSDSVPVLAISSCLDETGATRGQLHQMRDQVGAGASVCAASDRAGDAAAAFALVDRALASFAVDRPRARHITVPIAMLSAPAQDAPAAALPARATVAPEGIAPVAAALRAARRPLFIFGGGAVAGAKAARRLLAKTGAASLTTFAGRGIAAPDDPLHLGACLSRPDSAQVIAQADCVVAIGTELARVDLLRDTLGARVPLIRVDLDPEVLAQHGNGMALQGDAASFLRDLAACDLGPATRDWTPEDIAAHRAQFHRAVEAIYPGLPDLALAIQAALPEDTMFFSDMTQLAYTAKEVVAMPAPGLWHHPYGFGTLGYALPAAIGGKLGRGAAPVVAIAGDYGFQYTLAELGAAVELGLSLPIILWDNGKLKEIEDCMIAAQIAPNAVVAHNPDFCALARAYGAAAARPATTADMAQALQTALGAGRPTLIHLTPEILSA